jgi:hypothetical protein
MEGFPEELAQELKVDTSKKRNISLEEEYEVRSVLITS